MYSKEQPKKTYIDNLKEKGYVIIPNVLTDLEIEQYKKLFFEWFHKNEENLKNIHKTSYPHGIFKGHQVGHQLFAWLIRINPKVQGIFKEIWKTDKLVVSFDGCCYIPKDCEKKDNCWTHTDQGPSLRGLQCYQGYVALTSNKERTFRVYEESHLLHEKYFSDKTDEECKGNWHKIDNEYLKEIKESKKVLDVPSGSLVLWDSRCFHQNQFGKPKSEERLVQYVCFLPASHPKNTEAMMRKREKYFNELRTTSHWPCPIKVNGLQVRNYGDKSKIIKYENLTSPELKDIKEEALKIINPFKYKQLEPEPEI